MKVLFATTNPAKIRRYAEKLQKNNIEVITIKDIKTKIEVEENGKNALENAHIKAKAYFEETGITTIAEDTNMFIKGIPEEKQPASHIRRINGKRLNDDEAIKYYTRLVKQYGGKLEAIWRYAMVVYNGKDKKEFEWENSGFYLVDKPGDKRKEGYPLDTITIIPKYNKYLLDLTEEERKEYKRQNHEDEVINFIIESIR